MSFAGRRPMLIKELPPTARSSANVRGQRSRDNTPLSWNEFFDDCCSVDVDGDTFNVYRKVCHGSLINAYAPEGTSGPVFYLLHGGGYSGLTWACLTAELSSRIQCQILAPDLRGHGQTRVKDKSDLSAQQQTRHNGKKLYWVPRALSVLSSLPPLHMYGDSNPHVLINLNKYYFYCSMGGALAIHVAATTEIPNMVGLVVIDVVEGSAMDALSGMYTWRIDLTTTEPFWVGWFQGLSSKFLSCLPPKLLVLAGIDRLDKELTIAQMQGKFQNTILPKVGHAVQEDSPDRLADELARFAIRNRFAEALPGVNIAAARPMMGMGMMI
ncbi:unnamed protein product [Angiostrongylus costaricensis]|uniref:Protein phosphatase methylesterase 1 n=1 Tax=Angiostrongylus costaricensis TaxID=334426 RepID=A0A0R3PVY8_ANGCS|nr:unnamed protein product [Angiostrongylus costaricensis]